jgi:phospholipase/carboxylesterase
MGGFSQGAAMTLRMAATFPEMLAGILPHSGFVVPAVSERLQAGVFRGKGAFVAHGFYDAVLSITQGHEVREVLQVGGVDLTYREYQFAHQTSLESRRDLGDWLNKRLHF